MVNIIPKNLKEIWDDWNLRGAVLVSLTFQILLIFCASSRKRTGNMIMIFLIWSVYLLADWVAAFAVGLIANGNKDCDKKALSDNLLAFWAPFLLLHLGGPDTITAFALEDNELWLRHLLGLVIQLIAVGYVFLESIPNDLWIPTTLLLVAGLIKYAERTRALYLACLGNFKESLLPPPDAGPNYAQLMEEYSSKHDSHVPVEIIIAPEKRIEERTEKSSYAGSLSDPEADPPEPNHVQVEDGYNLYKIFRGLIVDHMFSFKERNDSRKFFSDMISNQAFHVLEVELNFMYDALYTKMVVVNGKFGYLFRLICTGCIAASLNLFVFYHKHKIHRFDIGVTYALLIGALGLDVIAIIKLIFSDWSIVLVPNSTAKRWIYNAREKLFFYKLWKPSKFFFDRRWSNCMSQHSLIRYSLRERFKWINKSAEFFGLKDLLDEFQYKKTMTVNRELTEFIFGELKQKAQYVQNEERKAQNEKKKAERSRIATEICSGRGDWILTQNSCHSLLWSVEKEFDECLLMWHIATELCYYTDGKYEKNERKNDSHNEVGGKKKAHNEVEEKKISINEAEEKKNSHNEAGGKGKSHNGAEEKEKSHNGAEEKKNSHNEVEEKDNSDLSKLLSEYMLYLLVMRPTMMSAVAGIGQIRFRDTCAEAKKFFRRGREDPRGFAKLRKQIQKFFCMGKSKPTDNDIAAYCQKLLSVNTVVKPIEVKGDRSKSVLFDACMLAKDLQKLNEKKRWKIMSKVWVELMSYAASHCRASAHAQQLSKGGELITFVWLLMAHFGLGDQFRIEEGHARAKLIVSK